MEILKEIFHRMTELAQRTWHCWLVLTAILLLQGVESPLQNNSIARENKVKAVFLYNFSQFIEWPAQSFDGDQSPFVIGILGKDSLSEYLSEISAGEKVRNREIVIKTFSVIGPETTQCQILYIEKNFASFDELSNLIKGKPVLTVSDHDHFMKEDGLLRFFVENDKVRFEVNREAAANAGLEISPKLLKLATIYSSAK